MPRPVKYESKSVKAVRGADKFVAGRMAKDGWELVDSVPGRISTTLSFRRAKKPLNRLAVGGGVAAVLVLIATIAVGSALEGRDAKPEAGPQSATSTLAAPPDPEPSEQPEEQPEPDVLTVENNADLAAVLAGPKRGPKVEAFSEKYGTKEVEFDAYVTGLDLNPREALGESTISLRAGDAKDKTHTGPVFELGWYGHDSPMEKFPKGTNVRVRAMVGVTYEFEPYQFFLVDEESDALTAR